MNCRQRSFLRMLIATALSGVAELSVAQVTDNELYAAYCIGALEWRQQNAESWSPSNPIVEQEKARQLREASQGLSRFRAYLVARGFGHGRNSGDVKGVALAMQRGRSDGM